MKKLLWLLSIVVMFALSSCSKTMGRYIPNSNNNNITQTQVVLSQNNYKIVKIVKTSIEYDAVIKSKFKDQLQNSAYSALLEQAHLTGSQALINVTFEQLETASNKGSRSTLINATGVVIEFTK